MDKKIQIDTFSRYSRVSRETIRSLIKYEELLISNNKLFTLNELDLTNDIDNVINVIKQCDLIITIDNTIAHLAGSLGKNVWVLLPYSADARWMEDITCSLVYQNTLLLRQNNTCNWKNVIKMIELALK